MRNDTASPHKTHNATIGTALNDTAPESNNEPLMPRTAYSMKNEGLEALWCENSMLPTMPITPKSINTAVIPEAPKPASQARNGSI